MLHLVLALTGHGGLLAAVDEVVNDTADTGGVKLAAVITVVIGVTVAVLAYRNRYLVVGYLRHPLGPVSTLSRAVIGTQSRTSTLWPDGHTSVPARFVVTCSEKLVGDHLFALDQLERAVAQKVTERALRDGTTLTEDVSVRVEPKPGMRRRKVRVAPVRTAAAGAVQLVGKETGEQITVPYLPADVGRDPSLPVVVDEEAVSWTHARIEMRDGQLTVRDHNSTNGTYVNGRLLRTQEPVVVGDGDTVEFGRAAFVVRRDRPGTGPGTVSFAERTRSHAPSPTDNGQRRTATTRPYMTTDN